MNSDIEKLDKIEAMLEDVLERQRLSRFDNLMFLAYPVLVSCTIILATTLLRFDELRQIKLAGVSIDSFIMYGSFILVFGLVWPFVTFIRAYVSDKLRGRIFACSRFVVGSLYYTIYLIVLPFLAAVQTYSSKYNPLYGFIIPMMFSISILYFTQWIIEKLRLMSFNWFSKNFARQLEVENVKLNLDGITRAISLNLKISKIIWTVACLSYMIVLLLAIKSEGLIGLTLYHTVGLVALALASAVALWRKAIRRKTAVLLGRHG